MQTPVKSKRRGTYSDRAVQTPIAAMISRGGNVSCYPLILKVESAAFRPALAISGSAMPGRRGIRKWQSWGPFWTPIRGPICAPIETSAICGA